MRELYYLDAARLQMFFDRVQQSRFLMFALLWILMIVGFLWAQDSMAAGTAGGGAGGGGGAAGGAVGDTAFQAFYDFVYSAATGNLGRGIALTGGIIGLGFGAASGRALPAIVGIVLAMFGALGPSIINTLFDTAII